MAGIAYGVLAGYDGSPCSKEALCWAAREARARGVALTVGHAWALASPVPPSTAAAFDLARRNGEQILAQGLRHAQDLAGPSAAVRGVLADGPAAAALCARSGGAEMVVVGTRGRGGLAGLLLGSVSSQVAALRGAWAAHAG